MWIQLSNSEQIEFSPRLKIENHPKHSEVSQLDATLKRVQGDNWYFAPPREAWEHAQIELKQKLLNTKLHSNSTLLLRRAIWTQ